MDRLKAHLAAQLRFIERSCSAFDAGDEAEAQRIACAIRVICHQTSRSTSLLMHLNSTNITMLSTASSPLGPGAPCNLASLVIECRDEGIRYNSIAPLENAKTKRSILFNDWWDNEVVCLADEVQLTRKSLVLSVADQDGGAHVDKVLNGNYLAIKSGGNLAITIQPNSMQIPLESHSATTLRQIGYEVLNSFDLIALRHAG